MGKFIFVVAFLAIFGLSLYNRNKEKKEQAQFQKEFDEKMAEAEKQRAEFENHFKENHFPMSSIDPTDDSVEVDFKVKGTSFCESYEISAAEMVRARDELFFLKDIHNDYDAFALTIHTDLSTRIGYVDGVFSESFTKNLDKLQKCMVIKVKEGRDAPYIYARAYFEPGTIIKRSRQ